MKKFALLAGLVIGVAGLAGWLLFSPDRKPSQPSKPREVPRRLLVLRDGRLYEPDQSAPFTGIMVEFYPNQARLSRSEIIDGQLNGVSEMWYPNGQLEVREHFKDSVSDGLREKWYENGARKSEAHIVHGKIEGIFQSWHQNGELAERIPMKNGEPDGTALAFYDSGFVKAQTRVAHGDVLERHSWPDGELKQPPALQSP